MADAPRPTSYYAGHTPEPWAADEGGQIFSSGETVNGGDIVCVPPEGFEASMMYWPANRRLFLDAPRLLRERDAAMDRLRRICERYERYDGSTYSTPREASDACRDAAKDMYELAGDAAVKEDGNETL